ncbi:MAG: hypothetical protein CMD09_03270 [Flavobacteriales bacterium]|nr:hypothetical protein [Flavobacteriales bacterium]
MQKMPKLRTPEDLHNFDELVIVGWRENQMIMTTSCKDKGELIEALEYLLEECYEWEFQESKYH